MTGLFCTRRKFLRDVLSTFALASCPLGAQAQPAMARIVVGFPPGGMPDILARRIGDALLGQYAKAIIVENKTGAGGQIAISDAMRSAADGTTLLLTPGSMLTIYPHTYKRLPYNPLSDLVPVCLAGSLVFAIAVGPAVPNSAPTSPSCWHGLKPIRHRLRMVLQGLVPVSILSAPSCRKLGVSNFSM